MSKFLNETGLSYFWSKIKTLLNNKVDKISGKQLSTNDYTTTEKNKLADINTSSIVYKTGNNTLKGLFEPATSGGANLGSTNYPFDNVYANNLNLTNSLSISNGGTGVSTLKALKENLDIDIIETNLNEMQSSIEI